MPSSLQTDGFRNNGFLRLLLLSSLQTNGMHTINHSYLHTLTTAPETSTLQPHTSTCSEDVTTSVSFCVRSFADKDSLWQACDRDPRARRKRSFNLNAPVRAMALLVLRTHSLECKLDDCKTYRPLIKGEYCKMQNNNCFNLNLQMPTSAGQHCQPSLQITDSSDTAR